VIFWPLRSISKQRVTDLHHAWKYIHRPQHCISKGLPITNVISAENRGHQLPPLGTSAKEAKPARPVSFTSTYKLRLPPSVSFANHKLLFLKS
jgi:hypothetical protein